MRGEREVLFSLVSSSWRVEGMLVGWLTVVGWLALERITLCASTSSLASLASSKASCPASQSPA